METFGKQRPGLQQGAKAQRQQLEREQQLQQEEEPEQEEEEGMARKSCNSQPWKQCLLLEQWLREVQQELQTHPSWRMQPQQRPQQWASRPLQGFQTQLLCRMQPKQPQQPQQQQVPGALQGPTTAPPEEVLNHQLCRLCTACIAAAMVLLRGQQLWQAPAGTVLMLLLRPSHGRWHQVHPGGAATQQQWYQASVGTAPTALQLQLLLLCCQW